VNKILSLLVLAMAITTGCSSTKIISSKKAEDVGPIDLTGKKVAALVVHADEATRIEAEDALAAELTKRGMVGVAAHTFIPSSDVTDKAKAKAAIKASGAVGVIITRLVGVEDTTKYVPTFNEAYYGSMSSYYDHSWANPYNPGTVQTFTTYSIETLAYRVSDEKLIWSGTSETFSPNSVKSMLREIVKEAGKVMKKQGLIVKK
jgi:hypothetical protein